MRKLVTIQEITSIHPIANADRLETAKVLGWNIVVGKNEFEPGDKIVFFEIDSLLPETDPVFEKFQARSQKTVFVDGKEIRGHVVSTMKLRGVISQGLVMALSDFNIDPDTEIGTEVTDLLGVVKWEEAIPVSSDIVGKFDSRFAPKSDAIRVQSLIENWDEIKQMDWEVTVKADGTSTTLINDDGKVRIFSRNWEISEDSTAFAVAKETGLIDEITKHTGMAVQFELVGPGIQSNRLKLSKLTPLVFAVWDRGQKLKREEWPELMLENAVPLLGDEWRPQGTVEEMIEKVSGLRGSITKNVLDEGIVFHTVGDNLPVWMDRNANFKIINNKFLIKHSI